jgi:hypothetical protein
MWLSSLVRFGMHQSANMFLWPYCTVQATTIWTPCISYTCAKERLMINLLQVCFLTEKEEATKVLLPCLRGACWRAIESVWPAILVPDDLHEAARI